MSKIKYVIGLNSGTSCDGIDVALVKFKKGDLKPIFVDGIVCDYPRHVRKLIVEICHGMSLQRTRELNFLLSKLFAEAALKIMRKNKLTSEDILLIGSHGQTIFHKPRVTSVQIGDGSVIAHQTNIRTISNFREADIKVGGEGAPLMPFLDWIIFNKNQQIKAVLNIGGISNVTVVGKNIIPIAFDIGPGNALIDLVSQIYFKKYFDKNGKIARKGKIHHDFIEKALQDAYFKKKPPKSTGKEYFNLNFVKKYFSVETCHGMSLLATVTYFSAKVIEKSFKDFILPKYEIKEMVLSGGGIKNKTLISHLKKLLPDIKLVFSDKYGMPSKYKEAMLFALLGYTCYLEKSNNIPSCTGAKTKVILGKINKTG